VPPGISIQAEAVPGRLALIAGNGRFPFLVLDAARDQGIDPLVVAIKEEASPELAQTASEVRWLSLGEVSKLLEILIAERVTRVLLAGQVKHAQLFSSIEPDGLLRRALKGMRRRSTDALIGAFVRMLEGRGIEVVDSTIFLKPLLPDAGPLTLPTFLMGAKSPRKSRGSISARPSLLPTGPVWRSRPWRGPTPRSNAPLN